MKISSFVHFTNILFVVILLFIISIGCKDPNSTNTNSTSNTSNNEDSLTKEITGVVFPANEVCKYPEIPIIKQYGGFNTQWAKRDTEVDLGADFRYLCSPYPTKRLVIINGGFSSTRITLIYDARGNRIEGAHTIYIEYNSDNYGNEQQFSSIDQKYRKEIVLPLFIEVVKKALKQSPSPRMLERVRVGKVSPRTADSCEKINNGYICIDNFGNEKAGFAAQLYIFSNEDALRKHTLIAN